MQRIIDYTVYVIVRLFICLIQALPPDVSWSIARGLAWLCGDVLRLRHQVVDENLRHALPELSDDELRRCERKMWEHLFLLIVEVAYVPRKIHETNWRDHVDLENIRPLVAQLLNDRPAILITGHFGNFEVGGYMLGLFGFPTHSVARTLDNPYLHDFVTSFRGATGQFLVPKNGGYDQILEVLGDRGTMAFLADQYAGPKGCWIKFFNRPASVYKAIGLLSLEYNAPIAVTYTLRSDRPLHFRISAAGVADPADDDSPLGSVRKITQWYTQLLEDGIRETPGQYWWIHKRWKDTRQKKSKPVKKKPDTPGDNTAEPDSRAA